MRSAGYSAPPVHSLYRQRSKSHTSHYARIYWRRAIFSFDPTHQRRYIHPRNRDSSATPLFQDSGLSLKRLTEPSQLLFSSSSTRLGQIEALVTAHPTARYRISLALPRASREASVSRLNYLPRRSFGCPVIAARPPETVLGVRAFRSQVHLNRPSTAPPHPRGRASQRRVRPSWAFARGRTSAMDGATWLQRTKKGTRP